MSIRISSECFSELQENFKYFKNYFRLQVYQFKGFKLVGGNIHIMQAPAVPSLTESSSNLHRRAIGRSKNRAYHLQLNKVKMEFKRDHQQSLFLM
jgi:hypothetical protein